MLKKQDCVKCENNYKCINCKYDCCKCPMHGCTYIKKDNSKEADPYSKPPKYRTIGKLPKV